MNTVISPAALPADQCDLIMKGGVTSGVIFPKAITRLAQKYRFVNVGGTSAGAIAAAFVAAAELQRHTHAGNEGFEVLDNLPEELAKNLQFLFQPVPEHKKFYRAAIKFLAKKNKKPVWFAIRNIFKICKSLKRLPNTYYGLCPGLTQPGTGTPGLTDWLNLWLENAAGTLTAVGGLPEKPLTFGDLKAANIKLRMITTNLSKQSPVTLPFSRGLLAKHSDLQKLLPANLVGYIIDWQDQPRDDGLLALPHGDDMPVLLAVRLSLSFPILLAALPLYQNDWTLHRCEEKMQTPQLSWFSDGGISSNFPIHLFDNPFPTRPTFGISLTDFNACRHEEDSGGQPGRNRVYLPQPAAGGFQRGIKPFDGIGGFLYAIFESAQNWQDAVQSTLPGYRERIVRLALKENEGGLNITMPEATVRGLTEIGDYAGRAICNDFDLDEHRWRRVLSAYAAMEQAFENLVDAYQHNAPEPVQQYLDRYRSAFQQGSPIASSYKPDNLDQFDRFKQRLDQLIALADTWKQRPLRERWGGSGMPRPRVSVRLFPGEFME